MPTESIVSRPATKFLSLKIARGMKVLRAVSMWTVNR